MRFLFLFYLISPNTDKRSPALVSESRSFWCPNRAFVGAEVYTPRCSLQLCTDLRARVCRAVKAVKPLGCLAMIDDGELDWKVRTLLQTERGFSCSTFSPNRFFRFRAWLKNRMHIRFSLCSALDPGAPCPCEPQG